MKQEANLQPVQNHFGGKDKSDEQFNRELAAKSVDIAERAIQNVKTLTERMRDAQLALDRGCSQFRAETLDWTSDQLPKALKDMRDTRMVINSELSLLMKPLEDLRRFFLGPDYEKEMARMKDFIDLCERLKALKDSGFLDSVADTMLRLS